MTVRRFPVLVALGAVLLFFGSAGYALAHGPAREGAAYSPTQIGLEAEDLEHGDADSNIPERPKLSRDQIASGVEDIQAQEERRAVTKMALLLAVVSVLIGVLFPRRAPAQASPSQPPAQPVTPPAPPQTQPATGTVIKEKPGLTQS